MDFNRGQQLFRANPAPEQPAPEAKATTKKQKKNMFNDKFSKITFTIILVASTIVAVGAIVLIMRPQSASQFVDKNAYQAVDVLSGGSSGDQVYFGKITKITDRQIILSNVFYPVSNKEGSSVTTLVPFVCSLAAPTDQLILNRDQVSYWYNLQSESKVTKTIDQYKSTNNGKPNCDQLNSSSNATQENTGSDTSNQSDTQTQSQTPTTGTGTNTGTGTTNQKPTSNP